MPVNFDITVEQPLLTVEMIGEIDDVTLGQACDAMMAAPDFHAVDKAFVDTSAVTGMTVTSATLRTIAERFSGAVPSQRMRTAVFAPSDREFGLTRVYGAFAELSSDGTVHPFRDRQAAMDWLFA